MIFTETGISGAYCIDLELIKDNRGFFARMWCEKEFKEHGLNSNLVQCNLSYNISRGTLRGMHYQSAPYEEAKLVTCIAGSIYDVILDLRRDSPTFRQWKAFELSASNYRMLYIPEGVAHGFQTLQDDTCVFYQLSDFYHPEAAWGVRWDDPSFGMEWPITEKIMSKKDQAYDWWSE
ncbi:dTDP-4-dehydrorhamnose 3,5-epimerase [Sporomusa malonica]|uniref:dTDP-4-dehydrorhamnose 3,5-epimerase n=1 Tax=Sporomusa malonica TaxID=112901 RepID=A0A1W2EUV7_9FIRM|nr:dTDP-4-dehydrorhamnose 3,5-epimerase [Sporomusa malonica]SMD13493.1 dTDP-4-dehydrorhamnose 3,5-epimerase [Sporomusa malonica]